MTKASRPGLKLSCLTLWADLLDRRNDQSVPSGIETSIIALSANGTSKVEMTKASRPGLKPLIIHTANMRQCGRNDQSVPSGIETRRFPTTQALLKKAYASCFVPEREQN